MAEQREQLEQSPPHSTSAERAVLGSILMNNELITQALKLLRADDFYVSTHRRTFMAMSALEDRGLLIDPVLLADEMKTDGTPERDGSITWLANLTYGIPHSTNLSMWANVIRRHSRTRWLLKFSERIKQAALDADTHPDDLAQWIVQEVDGTRSTAAELRRPKTLEELYEDQALRYQLFYKGITDAIPTGFPELDERMLGGGMLPTLMYVLAGRPSMGKTTLALDIASNVADQGRRCLIVSRETPAAMLVDRMVAAKSGLARFRLSAGMSKRDYELAMETLQAMRLCPIILDDVSTTIHEVDRVLTEYARGGERVDFVMMDYLQLMSGTGSADGRTQEVSKISSGFKGLLMKHNIPGIAISQLSRAPGNGEPELTHLRESGQIEQDADMVLFVHGDPTEEDSDFLMKELICKKQRDGPHFRVPMDMNTQLVTFRRPEMLGLGKAGGVKPRRLGTDEEEILRQKTGGRRAQEDEVENRFDF